MTNQGINEKKKSFLRKYTSGYGKSDILFFVLNYFLLFLFFLIVLYPLLYVIMSSFAGGGLYGNGLSLIPKEWSLEGYKAVLEYKYIWSGFGNSVLLVIITTTLALINTILCAYPLSRPDLAGRGFFMGLCMFVMYFNGGLIPTYLWIKQLGFINTWWALILPASLSIYNMIVMRTYFASQIPLEMREAAQIDGCGNWRFLLQIVLPLSGPILAVIGMYYAVAMWNSYFNAMIYINDKAKMPLPNILRDILIINESSNNVANGMDTDAAAKMEKRAEVMKYSLMVISTTPMMILYPFVQKYFVKGVMIGAVKG